MGKVTIRLRRTDTPFDPTVRALALIKLFGTRHRKVTISDFCGPAGGSISSSDSISESLVLRVFLVLRLAAGPKQGLKYAGDCIRFSGSHYRRICYDYLH